MRTGADGESNPRRSSAPRMRSVLAFNARFINPVMRRLAAWLPGFAILCHVGRKSGRTYCIPINVFKRGDHYHFALTYGSDVDWVKNVLAAGGCELRTVGKTLRLVEPELIADRDLLFIPFPGRLIERWNGVTEVLRMRAA
jgi:deazaflavin-dependent oxidoreductase (nitroreductase family)